MIKLKMRNYNMILLKRRQKYLPYHQDKYLKNKQKLLKIKEKTKLRQLKNMENKQLNLMHLSKKKNDYSVEEDNLPLTWKKIDTIEKLHNTVDFNNLALSIQRFY